MFACCGSFERTHSTFACRGKCLFPQPAEQKWFLACNCAVQATEKHRCFILFVWCRKWKLTTTYFLKSLPAEPRLTSASGFCHLLNYMRLMRFSVVRNIRRLDAEACVEDAVSVNVRRFCFFAEIKKKGSV